MPGLALFRSNAEFTLPSNGKKGLGVAKIVWTKIVYFDSLMKLFPEFS
jgi:hypothetical protein